MAYYVGVVHRAQVAVAAAAGFVAFSHGREAAVRGLAPDDRVIYYAPKADFDGAPVRAFVAHATVTGTEVATRDFGGRTGHVRAARHDAVMEAPVRPLIGVPDFVPEGPSWGVAFRNGKFEIGAEDYQRPAGALMGGG